LSAEHSLERFLEHYPDIFGSPFQLPSKVCIVAPGPNGRDHYAAIPDDFYQIAVAKAVLIPGLSPAVWVMNHADQDWFDEADRAFNGIRIFGDATFENSAVRAAENSAVRAAENRAVRAAHTGERYSFTPPAQDLSPDMLHPVDGCIRVGATVSGCALQVAYNFGAREVLLCGVDMSGDNYWDGTSNVQPMHGPVWNASRSMNQLIHWMTHEKGLKIRTLSPTRLDVPFFRSRAASA
jgi:hypothetical protein